MGITVAIAERRPQDIHAQCLDDKMLQALVHGYAVEFGVCFSLWDPAFLSIKATCCFVCQCCCNSPSRFPQERHYLTTWVLAEAPNCQLSFPQRFEQLLSGNMWRLSFVFAQGSYEQMLCYMFFVRLRLGARGNFPRASSLEDTTEAA